MEVIYFTAVAVILYLVSDWILQQFEARAGKRFEHRSLIFFAILLTLAISTFSLIQQYTGNS
ncbi:MAG: hypothetical protein OEM63_14955 [Gammaproteobacteria bacterium]|nr:hypothetical protein [Gammaproteobacteria bacterium]